MNCIDCKHIKKGREVYPPGCQVAALSLCDRMPSPEIMDYVPGTYEYDLFHPDTEKPDWCQGEEAK